jgi:uncharacterized protein (TIGR03437 family)
MSNFNSDSSSFGTWRLAIENDESDSRTGWFRELSLTITGTPQTAPVLRPSTVVNAASLTGAGTVAPGEMVRLVGPGVGPSVAVSAPSGALPTTLGGVTVTFNGTAVPISYAGFFQLVVQAPFNLTIGQTVNVIVTSNNTASSPLTLNVVAAVPGIYTHGSGGSGAVQAINQSGATNGTSAPAPKGSYITIWASGLGNVSPTVTAGAVPPNSPLSTTVNPVTAVIGGISAPVSFAGLAPGYPGLYQLNIQVPANAPSGSQEMTIYVNGVASQTGATVSIQ